MKQVANHFYILLIGALYACQPIHEPGNLVPPTVVEDPNLGRDEVTVEGISRLIHRRIYPSDSAIESGTRQVAIVLHNEFTDTKTYHDFCMTLGRSFPVISYDPGGLGLSERIPASEWTFKAALEELKAIKEKNFRDGRVILIGHGFGGALAANYIFFEQPRQILNGSDSMQGAYLGPEFGKKEIEKVIRKYDAESKYYENFDELAGKVAGLLGEGNVVGWFNGRMEFGPRALGNRSILGDARNPEMQKKLNLKIKYRESFRPFAPSVMEEENSRIFDIKSPSPYMLLVADVNKDIRKENSG